MIKVLIADDHAIVRGGLKQILADTSDITVAGEAGHGQEVLERLNKNSYDVVVLDISMPGRSGLDILAQLRREFPRTRVLILSMHPEEQYAMRALKAGASGYLTKESVPDELIAAIRKVSAGRKYISSSLAERLAMAWEDGREKSMHERLSDREYEIMCMIARGKSVKEIAVELHLSIKTVSTYRSRILTKTDMKNNAEIIYYAIKNNIID
jgi:two-component system, NarL family, invasion response regulator UvrY